VASAHGADVALVEEVAAADVRSAGEEPDTDDGLELAVSQRGRRVLGRRTDHQIDGRRGGRERADQRR
jgi:hypothetical protein